MNNKVDNRNLPHWLWILMAVVLISVLVFPNVGLMGGTSAVASVVLFLIGIMLEMLTSGVIVKFKERKAKRAV